MSIIQISETPQTLVKTVKFVTPKCSLCHYEMHFKVGDVIYGEKWYHSLCWEAVGKTSNEAPPLGDTVEPILGTH